MFHLLFSYHDGYEMKSKSTAHKYILESALKTTEEVCGKFYVVEGDRFSTGNLRSVLIVEDKPE